MGDFRRLAKIYTGYVVYSLEKRRHTYSKGFPLALGIGNHIYPKESPLAFFKREEDAYTCYPDRKKFKIVPVNKGKLAKILMSGF